MKLHSSYLVCFDTPALERLASDCDFHTVPTIRGSLSLGKGKYLDGEGVWHRMMGCGQITTDFFGGVGW